MKLRLRRYRTRIEVLEPRNAPGLLTLSLDLPVNEQLGELTSASTEDVPRGEREMIEAALAESRGRVAGPSGAAAKLRIPASTLESKIKALRIRKSQFKF